LAHKILEEIVPAKIRGNLPKAGKPRVDYLCQGLSPVLAAAAL
jgi:hypothetical protein